MDGIKTINPVVLNIDKGKKSVDSNYEPVNSKIINGINLSDTESYDDFGDNANPEEYSASIEKIRTTLEEFGFSDDEIERVLSGECTTEDIYAERLSDSGLTDEDIRRLLSNEISYEELIEEIMNDEDTTRCEKLLGESYFDVFKKSQSEIAQSDINRIDDEITQKQSEIDEKKAEIEELKGKRTAVENDWEYGVAIETSSGMHYSEDQSKKIGEISLDIQNLEDEIDALESDIDDLQKEKEGILSSQDISQMIEDVDSLSELRDRIEQYKDELSSLVDQRRSITSKIENARRDKIQTASGDYYSSTQQAEISKLQAELSEFDKEYSDKIKELNEKIETLKAIQDSIESQVSEQVNLILPYKNSDDFSINSVYKDIDSENYLNDIGSKYFFSADSGTINISDINDEAKLLYEMINGKIKFNSDSVFDNGSLLGINICSSDGLIQNYAKWIDKNNESNGSVITSEEVEVFNYIYNTSGAEASIDYLNNLKGIVDLRYVSQKTIDDQEYADDHPFVSSTESVVLTPIEGLRAALLSTRALINKDKILRTDVYSSGDVFRAKISQNILNDYGEGWAFLYGTGMSMADTAPLLALGALTGGSSLAMSVLSPTLMGSRAYVSTINDALDRGLSDGQAVGLAYASSAVESLMEGYSAGHLLNLEGKLDDISSSIIKNVEKQVGKNSAAAEMSKIVAGCVSQGFAEGEEEACTEIANSVVDGIISGGLSNYNTAIDNYMKSGYSLSEAQQLYTADYLSQVYQSFLGGFVSGVGFGGMQGFESVIKQESNNIALDMIEKFDSSKVTDDSLSMLEQVAKNIMGNYGNDDFSMEIRRRIENNISSTQKNTESDISQINQENIKDSAKINNRVLSNIINRLQELKADGNFSISTSAKEIANSIKEAYVDASLEPMYLIPPEMHLFDNIFNIFNRRSGNNNQNVDLTSNRDRIFSDIEVAKSLVDNSSSFSSNYNISDYFADNNYGYIGLEIVTPNQSVGGQDTSIYAHSSLLDNISKCMYDGSSIYDASSNMDFGDYAEQNNALVYRLVDNLIVEYSPSAMNSYQNAKRIDMLTQIAELNKTRSDNEKIKLVNINEGIEQVVDYDLINQISSNSTNSDVSSVADEVNFDQRISEIENFLHLNNQSNSQTNLNNQTNSQPNINNQQGVNRSELLLSNINNIIQSTMSSLNITEDQAIRQVESYLRTGQENLISSRAGARDMIKAMSRDEIRTTLDLYKGNISFESARIVFDTINKWGREHGAENYAQTIVDAINRNGIDYVLSHVTTDMNARNIIKLMDPESVKVAYDLYRGTYTSESIQIVFNTINKWGKEHGAENYAQTIVNAINHNGIDSVLSHIPTDNYARDFIKVLSPEKITNIYNSYKSSNIQDNQSNELNEINNGTVSLENASDNIELNDENVLIRNCETLDDYLEQLYENGGSYGIGQGCLTNLAVEDSLYYESLKNKMVQEYGFYESDVSDIFSMIDNVGACTYARSVNVIFEFFKDKPDQFEQIFGFPLYRRNADGKIVINDGELLLDLYYWGNAISDRSEIFVEDENGKKVINDNIRRILQNGGGVLPQKGASYRDLKDYLNYKSPNIDIRTDLFLDNNRANNRTQVPKEIIKSIVKRRLDNGESLSMGVSPLNGTTIGFTDVNNPNITINVAGSHFVKITGVNDEGIIVSSWGKKCIIKFEDLVNVDNVAYNFISDRINVVTSTDSNNGLDVDESVNILSQNNSQDLNNQISEVSDEIGGLETVPGNDDVETIDVEVNSHHNINDSIDVKQQRLSDEIEKFDLDEFLHNNGASDAAIGLITSEQTVFCDTYVREEDDIHVGNHQRTMGDIYETLFGDGEKILFPGDYIWQDKVLSDGNVVIQFVNDDITESRTLIWLPDNIDEYQLEQLKDLNNQVKQIIDNDSDYFSQNPRIFSINYKNDIFEYTNNIDSLIEMLESDSQGNDQSEITENAFESNDDVDIISNIISKYNLEDEFLDANGNPNNMAIGMDIYSYPLGVDLDMRSFYTEMLTELLKWKCNSANIDTNIDFEQSINNVFQNILSEMDEWVQDSNLEQSYIFRIEDVIDFNSFNSKVENDISNASSIEELNRIESALKNFINFIRDYIVNNKSDYLNETVEILSGTDADFTDEELLKNYQESVIAAKLVKYYDQSVELLNKATVMERDMKLSSFTSDQEFIDSLSKIMNHDSENVVFRYHGTQSLSDCENIMSEGLLMMSDDLDRTSYSEMTMEDLLLYSRGFAGEVGRDGIVIFAVPKGEDVVSDISNQGYNFSQSGLGGFSSDGPKYMVPSKYIVGYVDKVNHKVIYNPDYYENVEELESP